MLHSISNLPYAEMHQKRVLGVHMIFTTLLLMITSVRAKDTSPECEMCLDVAGTFHSTFDCMSNYGFPYSRRVMETQDVYNDFSAPRSPDIGPAPRCNLPTFQCSNLDEPLRGACEGVEEELQRGQNAQIVWDSLGDNDDPFRACHTLGMCTKKDKSDFEVPSIYRGSPLTKCDQVFSLPKCRHRYNCEEYSQHCSQRCFLCTWLLKEWPRFHGVCHNGGGSTPSATSFLEIDPSKILGGMEQLVPAAAANAGGLAPSVGGYTAGTSGECMKMWHEFRNSHKAWWTLVWRRRPDGGMTVMDPSRGIKAQALVWDPYPACQCLGKCKLGARDWVHLRLSLIHI